MLRVSNMIGKRDVRSSFSSTDPLQSIESPQTNSPRSTVPSLLESRRWKRRSLKGVSCRFFKPADSNLMSPFLKVSLSTLPSGFETQESFVQCLHFHFVNYCMHHVTNGQYNIKSSVSSMVLQLVASANSLTTFGSTLPTDKKRKMVRFRFKQTALRQRGIRESERRREEM